MEDDDATMMLTSDISLTKDPEGVYQKYVKLYSEDMAAYSNAFSHAWYKLTTRDMGPVTRCVGTAVPPAQQFQNPLPEPPSPSELPDFEQVRVAVRKAMYSERMDVLAPDYYNGRQFTWCLCMR